MQKWGATDSRRLWKLSKALAGGKVGARRDPDGTHHRAPKGSEGRVMTCAGTCTGTTWNNMFVHDSHMKKMNLMTP